jgi:hypothetical protein
MDTALRFKETAAGQSLVFYRLPQKINPQLRLGQFDLLDGVGVSRVWTGMFGKLTDQYRFKEDGCELVYRFQTAHQFRPQYGALPTYPEKTRQCLGVLPRC